LSDRDKWNFFKDLGTRERLKAIHKLYFIVIGVLKKATLL